MKKGYYIHAQGRHSIGISKKIDMQIEEFSKYYDMKELEIQTLERTLAQRIWGLFPTASIARDYDQCLNKLDNPDFIYARRAVADKAYLEFWKKVRKKFPDCKIIIEIFTYPYDKDNFAKWDAWPFYIKELIYRRKLKKYIDRFAVYTNDKRIFGVPTIQTTNGVNIQKIDIVKGEYQDNRITLIGVAYMQRQHGYERVIDGLWNYYQNKDTKYIIELLLIGDGPEKFKYQERVQQYHLQNYVKFYPTMQSPQLDEMYDMSDMALAVFGMYKVGVDRIAALKTREYLAKGMPIITGCQIDVCGEQCTFVKNFPNNAQYIDMCEVVKFYEAIKKENTNKKAVANKIREFAVQNVGMASVMQPIIDYIEE